MSIFNSERQNHGLEKVFDNKLIQLAKPAIKDGTPVRHELEIGNRDRTTGAMLSGRIAKKYGHEGLPEDTVWLSFTGTAGQAFGAWVAQGVTLELDRRGE